MRPQRRQLTRLPCPWDSPGKNTGVGCHFLLQCMKVKSESEVTQSCPTLRDSMDCSRPGSSVHGILQVRVLEWGAIAFSIQSHRPCTIVGNHFSNHQGKRTWFSLRPLNNITWRLNAYGLESDFLESHHVYANTWFWYLLAVLPWSNYLIFLCLGFLFFKIR